MVEKAEIGRPGNVGKSALHTVLDSRIYAYGMSLFYLPLGITLKEGNAGFQTLPVLRLTPKDQSASQLHTLAAPPSTHKEVICRKFSKMIAEEIPYMSITQPKERLWSSSSLHYRCYFSSRKLPLACHVF